jgi:hypothetical protein
MKRGLWRPDEEMNDEIKVRCKEEGMKSKWLHGNTVKE